jgi:predicted class III extradiol MEMO1 family dioxygenase
MVKVDMRPFYGAEARRCEVRRRWCRFAGSWYPDDPVRLREAVDRYVTEATVDALPRRPRALIAPHAGLMYSGPVAGFSYKVVRDLTYHAVVLVGPSHFVPFRGVSLWSDGAWETPFGPLKVDVGLAGAIRAESADVVEVAEAHGREHSLEMQLPFEDARVASVLDQIVLTHVDALDADGLMAALEREPRHACGGGPMVSVLHAARQLGASSARVLRYADSGDVSGDKSAVVGYMAAAIW